MSGDCVQPVGRGATSARWPLALTGIVLIIGLFFRFYNLDRKILMALGRKWQRDSRWLLWALNLLLAAYAMAKLGTEFWRLLGEQGEKGALDLAMRHHEVQAWFAGLPMYGAIPSAVYPPASHVLLWPLLGWLSFSQARWLWGILYVGALFIGVRLAQRESRAQTFRELVLVALLMLSMNATGICVGNGQLSILTTVMVLASLLNLDDRDGRRVKRCLCSAVPFLWALVKPTMTAPFYWLILFRPGRWRMALWIAASYLLVTLLASAVRPESLTLLVVEWLQAGQKATVHMGSVDLHVFLYHLSLAQWTHIGSALVVGILGLYVWRKRRSDLWLIMGTIAIVARLWTCHGLYDDFLLILPMIALFRSSKILGSGTPMGVASGVLCAISALAMLLPARLFNLWPSPWPQLFLATHLIVWLMDLIFLGLLIQGRHVEQPASSSV